MGGAEEEAAGVGVGIPLHLGGNVYQRAGAGLKRKASWLHNLLVPLGGGKGGASITGEWQTFGHIFEAVSSPLSKAFFMSFTSTWDPDTRKIPSCCSPRKSGKSDQGEEKANSQPQLQA